MAKRQTRKAITVKGTTHQRLKDYAAAQGGRSLSGILEELIHEKLDDAGVPMPTSIDDPKPREESPEEIISQHFTF